MKEKITLSYPKSAAMEFFQGTQEGVRNSHGKRAITVRATEGLNEQSDQGLHCFVSPICPNTKIFTIYNTLKIMHNIPREKYFDIVAEG